MLFEMVERLNPFPIVNLHGEMRISLLEKIRDSYELFFRLSTIKVNNHLTGSEPRLVRKQPSCFDSASRLDRLCYLVFGRNAVDSRFACQSEWLILNLERKRLSLKNNECRDFFIYGLIAKEINPWNRTVASLLTDEIIESVLKINPTFLFSFSKQIQKNPKFLSLAYTMSEFTLFDYQNSKTKKIFRRAILPLIDQYKSQLILMGNRCGRQSKECRVYLMALLYLHNIT